MPLQRLLPVLAAAPVGAAPPTPEPPWHPRGWAGGGHVRHPDAVPAPGPVHGHAGDPHVHPSPKRTEGCGCQWGVCEPRTVNVGETWTDCFTLTRSEHLMGHAPEFDCAHYGCLFRLQWSAEEEGAEGGDAVALPGLAFGGGPLAPDGGGACWNASAALADAARGRRVCFALTCTVADQISPPHGKHSRVERGHKGPACSVLYDYSSRQLRAERDARRARAAAEASAAGAAAAALAVCCAAVIVWHWRVRRKAARKLRPPPGDDDEGELAAYPAGRGGKPEPRRAAEAAGADAHPRRPVADGGGGGHSPPMQPSPVTHANV